MSASFHIGCGVVPSKCMKGRQQIADDLTTAALYSPSCCAFFTTFLLEHFCCDISDVLQSRTTTEMGVLGVLAAILSSSCYSSLAGVYLFDYEGGHSLYEHASSWDMAGIRSRYSMRKVLVAEFTLRERTSRWQLHAMDLVRLRLLAWKQLKLCFGWLSPNLFSFSYWPCKLRNIIGVFCAECLVQVSIKHEPNKVHSHFFSLQQVVSQVYRNRIHLLSAVADIPAVAEPQRSIWLCAHNIDSSIVGSVDWSWYIYWQLSSHTVLLETANYVQRGFRWGRFCFTEGRWCFFCS